MRIVSGKYRSRRFDVPNSFQARPTTDFAKENLFNILSNRMSWEDTRALDLFSGTGSIAFELLSRGCKEVVCVEKDFYHYAFIKKVKAELKDEHLIAIKTDAFRFIETCRRSFDFVFADPPYALPELAQLPDLIFRHNLVKSGGLLVLEHPKEYDFSVFKEFERRRCYGAVNFSIFST
jgi:16S rRNA (guanine(966)-N(2))-methyltransferase RsmD